MPSWSHNEKKIRDGYWWALLAAPSLFSEVSSAYGNEWSWRPVSAILPQERATRAAVRLELVAMGRTVVPFLHVGFRPLQRADKLN